MFVWLVLVLVLVRVVYRVVLICGFVLVCVRLVLDVCACVVID